MKRTYRDLTPQELEAVHAFASQEGRRWKAKLNEVYWYNARIWYGREPGLKFDPMRGTLLHGLRNSHGPDWLAGFKLPKA